MTLGFAVIATACGPVEYITNVTLRAAKDVDAAKRAKADQLAPYEYTLAEEYLHKAREEEGYADHQAAVKFGKLASRWALAAQKLAQKGGAETLAPTGKGEGPEPSFTPAEPENEDSPPKPPPPPSPKRRK